MAIISTFDGDSGGSDMADMSKMAAMFGPGQVDQMIKQAIQICWMMLPPDKKNADELESTIRRIVDRALQNFREDAATFGASSST